VGPDARRRKCTASSFPVGSARLRRRDFGHISAAPRARDPRAAAGGAGEARPGRSRSDRRRPGLAGGGLRSEVPRPSDTRGPEAVRDGEQPSRSANEPRAPRDARPTLASRRALHVARGPGTGWRARTSRRRRDQGRRDRLATAERDPAKRRALSCIRRRAVPAGSPPPDLRPGARQGPLQLQQARLQGATPRLQVPRARPASRRQVRAAERTASARRTSSYPRTSSRPVFWSSQRSNPRDASRSAATSRRPSGRRGTAAPSQMTQSPASSSTCSKRVSASVSERRRISPAADRAGSEGVARFGRRLGTPREEPPPAAGVTSGRRPASAPGGSGNHP